ncbi:MAG: membrane protein FxsA [Rhizobiales bacterium]|nr:membrane protein FxsA [Hyphomicrobiales bacterium]MBA70717.1 membrane protein FxsA [Hyphomicrobiales bacterium]|tara:strand:+ start:1773 stop:2336 length:564 start_codon:yes stop_codon:yes gene_type:complete
MRFSLIPFALIVIPIAEIAAFITIGGEIGVLPTLGLVVVTAIIGTALLRWQGIGLLNRIRAETDAGRVPGRDLADGAMILVAGVLLLTPGFVTDTLGFLLFVPAIRDRAWKFLKGRITVVASNTVFTSGGGGPRRNAPPGKGPVVDLDEEDYHDDSPRRPNPESPWNERNRTIENGTDSPSDDRRNR